MIRVRTVGQPVVLDRVSRSGEFDVDPTDPTVARLLASGHLEEVADVTAYPDGHQRVRVRARRYPDPLPQGEFLPDPEEN